jgi:FkbM family methyltransferase
MRSLLHTLWALFNALPEGTLKMRLRFFLAFSRIVPSSISKMSPIRASIYHYTPAPGDTVVDAGAFPGDFTVFAARRVGPSGKVIAFEPNPVNFKRLQRHVAAFGCTNVVLLPKGLWSREASMQMGGAGVDTHLGAQGEHTVELVTLDGELARLGVAKVDFIKMDIEGAEVEALKGARQTLARQRVNLAIASYHDFEGHPTRRPIEEFVAGLGYTFVTEYPQRQNTYAWRAGS